MLPIAGRIAVSVALISCAVLPAHAQQLPSQPPADPARTQVFAPQLSVPPPADPMGTQVLAQLPGQPPTNPSDFAVLVTPYLWMPWVSAHVNPSVARFPNLPSVSDTIGAGTVISHLTWVPFMGEAEFRDGPYGFITDYIHAPFKAGINTPNLIFGGANAGLTLDTGTGMFLYRMFSDPDQYVDLGVGLRAWGISGNLSENQRLLPLPLPPITLTNGGAWVDGLASARYHRELGDGFSATAYGDIGGGGASLDWQAVATLDYVVQPGFDLHGGFRAMGFNQSGALSSFSVHLYGPILAATFHFP
jgi:hypothetical protein